MKNVIWLDTETTGLYPNKHGLREVGYMVYVDGELKEEDVFYIDPNTYRKDIIIDPKALEISGLDEIEFDDKKYKNSIVKFSDFMRTLKKYSPRIEDDLDLADGEEDYRFQIIGFNIAFDIGFIKEWMKDADIGYYFSNVFTHKSVCVFELVKNLKYLGLIDTENDKLETLCKHFGIPHNSHTALGDIEATKQLYEVLVHEFIKVKQKNEYMQFELIKQALETPGEIVPYDIGSIDRLDELEAKILEYYLDKGFKTLENQTSEDKEWWFEVHTSTGYKKKHLAVDFFEADKEADEKSVFSVEASTTEEMFDKAFEYFSLEDASEEHH